MIAHASHDENGTYTGGKAGDQTGGECCIRDWYNRPWNIILRPMHRKDAWKIAETMVAAANNDHIGYDQNQRTTLYTEAQKVNFDLAKITTDCECDCSSLVSVAVNSAGIPISKDAYTGSLRKILLNTGKFNEITSKQHLNSDAYLLKGDILLYEGHHVAVNLTDGNSAYLWPIGWQKDNIGWWYSNTNTTYYHDTWVKIKGYLYYFNSDGYAVTGTQYINGSTYYFKDKIGIGKNSSNVLECALCTTDEKGALTPHIFN